MSLIVNWRRIPPRIPPESAGIPEFRRIPADSPRNTWIPGGISGGMKSIAPVSMAMVLAIRSYFPFNAAPHVKFTMPLNNPVPYSTEDNNEHIQ